MKISVIIPIYKVEQYLCQCIDSVLAQTYTDLEIILVDDGSPDGCGAICDRYARQDPRIRVIHQENKGLSEARNAGTEIATGSYILFLDSDDYWVDPQAVSILVKRAKKTSSDVINFSFTKIYEDGRCDEPYFAGASNMPELMSKSQQLHFLMEQGVYIACAWNKMIKRSLLQKLRFPVGIFSEDIVWCAKLLLLAQSIDFVNANFHRYRQRKNSIRYTMDTKKCTDLTENILETIAIGEAAPEDIREPILCYAAFQYGTFFINQAMADCYQRENIRTLTPKRWILKHHHGNRKLQCLDLSCRVITMPGTCALIRVLYRR